MTCHCGGKFSPTGPANSAGSTRLRCHGSKYAVVTFRYVRDGYGKSKKIEVKKNRDSRSCGRTQIVQHYPPQWLEMRTW